jgi:hypothetical protein
MYLLAHGVVLLAELDQLAQLVLQQLRLLAHRDQLALADGHRAAAVGMGDLQVHQHVHVVLEETRVLAQELRHLVGCEQRLSPRYRFHHRTPARRRPSS